MKKQIIIVASVIVSAAFAAAQSAEEIIRKMDDMQTFEALYMEGTMVATDRFGDKRSTYKSWSRNGGGEIFLEFTNIEERGQKILKSGNELYLFYPDAEDIIPMEGSALKQSVFGDVSYEDISEGRNTLEKYSVSIIDSTEINDEDCWVIEMIAKTKKVPYPKQKVIISKADYILKEVEFFARSGRLLKIMHVLEHKEFPGGKVIITKMELSDQIRKNSKTVVTLSQIDLNPQVGDDRFSLHSLY